MFGVSANGECRHFSEALSMYALQIQTFEKNLRWIKDENSKPSRFFQHQLLYYEDQYSELVSMANVVELMLGKSAGLQMPHQECCRVGSGSILFHSILGRCRCAIAGKRDKLTDMLHSMNEHRANRT